MPREVTVKQWIVLSSLVLTAGSCGEAPTSKAPVINTTNNESTGDEPNESPTKLGGDNIPPPDSDVDDPDPKPADGQGPEFLELQLSTDQLSRGDQIVITAFVTDPQGFGDIGGGRLVAQDGTVYGPFVGTAGSYQAVLTWSGIDDIAPIAFDEDLELRLRAEFFDAANNRSFEDIVVTLHCNGAPACDGFCDMEVCTPECAEWGYCEVGQCEPVREFTFPDPQHCGGCGIACEVGQACTSEGQCIWP